MASTSKVSADSKDKYVVSFNSDTSDSEDDSSESTTTDRGLTNGHVDNDIDVSYSINLSGNASESSEDATFMSGNISNGLAGKDPEYSFSIAQKVGNEIGEIASKPPPINTTQEEYTDLSKAGAVQLGRPVTKLHNQHGLEHDESKHNIGAHKRSANADLLIDIYGTSPLNSPGRTNTAESTRISSDLEGLSFSPRNKTVSPKHKVNMDEQLSGSSSMEYNHMKGKDLDHSESEYNRSSANSDGTNNLTGLNLRDASVVTVSSEDKSDVLDADLLIYASPGTSKTIDFEKSDLITGYRRSKSYEEDLSTEEASASRREILQKQKSMPEENGTRKSNYTSSLDEKFSAICSKYGKDPLPKREKARAQDAPSGDNGKDVDKAGLNRTQPETNEEIPQSPKRTKPDISDNTPRKKLNFDDVISWDKSSTDELIKRILEDARAETGESTRYKSSTKSNHETKQTSNSYESRHAVPEPYESEMGRSSSYTSKYDRDHDDAHNQPSLLERRLASYGGRDRPAEGEKSTALVPYEPQVAKHDDTHEHLYKRKSRGSKSNEFDDDSLRIDTSGTSLQPWKQRQKAAYDDDDEDYSYKAPGGYQPGYQGGYQGGQQGGYQGGYALAVPGRYDDSDSDNESYVSRRSVAPVLPDEAFMPQRSEDTRDVVKERTSEVRNMVEHQTEVLGRLKKASDSFEELDAEIKQLKQEMIESQAARQTIMEDLIADIQESAAAQAPEESSPYSRRYTRSSLQRSDNMSNYSSSYTPSYTPRYGRTRDTESCSRLDNDIESDRLGGYALGAVAKSKWGEPGGSRAFRSASVCRYDDVEEERYDRWGLYNTRKPPADDSDAKSDFGIEAGDDAETASIKSYPSEKSNDDRSDDNGNGGRSRYRSRYAVAKYTPPSYDSSTSYGGSSFYTSSRPSRASSMTRSYTTDYSFDRPKSRSGSVPPLESKPFTSRFLSKVREKRDSGEYSKPATRDKPFKSRFLTRSVDSDYYSGSSSRGSLASTPDKNSTSPRSRDEEVSTEATA